jgi:hypothetical protein
LRCNGTGNGVAWLPQVDLTKPQLKIDILNTKYASPERPKYIKFRQQITGVGAYPFHCHLEYHIYK